MWTRILIVAILLFVVVPLVLMLGIHLGATLVEQVMLP